MSPNFRRILLQRAARLFDLLVVSLIFIASLAISFNYFIWPTLAEFLLLRVSVINILAFCCYLAVCSAIFSNCGVYLSHRLSLWRRVASEMLLATTLITALLIVLPFNISFVTKDFIIVFWLMTSSVLLLSRLVGYRLLYYARSRGRNRRNVVVVGEVQDAGALANRIERDVTLGYHVVRILTPGKMD